VFFLQLLLQSRDDPPDILAISRNHCRFADFRLRVSPGIGSAPSVPNRETLREAAMEQNKFKGNWHQFKGELKRKWGQLTENDLLECEGDYEKFLGMVQKRYGERAGEVQQWADDWYSQQEQEEIRRRHATVSRNQV
jgi:uncharacterized protein YjbJ (UPF0337 family)